MSAIVVGVIFIVSAVIHPLLTGNSELQTAAEIKTEKMKWITAPSLVSVYVLALWVGWVHAAAQRLRGSLLVQMVEHAAFKSSLAGLARRMQWLQFYVLAGAVGLVYALTHLRMMGDTLLLYAFVFAGFAILASLYHMYAMSEKWQPMVNLIDPENEKNALPPTAKSNAVVEGVTLMALTLFMLCVASVRAKRASHTLRPPTCTRAVGAHAPAGRRPPCRGRAPR